MRKLKIEISGVPASGKTTVGTHIAQVLKEAGFSVSFKDYHEDASAHRQRARFDGIAADTSVEIVVNKSSKKDY